MKSRHHVSELCSRIYLRALPTRLNRDNQRPDGLTFSVTPSQLHAVQEC